ncbi:MAG: hypothetical protein E7494_04265 [Ruminococcus albus]|nr:hypothetical protein [Ruminococcus albus]
MCAIIKQKNNYHHRNNYSAEEHSRKCFKGFAMVAFTAAFSAFHFISQLLKILTCNDLRFGFRKQFTV